MIDLFAAGCPRSVAGLGENECPPSVVATTIGLNQAGVSTRSRWAGVGETLLRFCVVVVVPPEAPARGGEV